MNQLSLEQQRMHEFQSCEGESMKRIFILIVFVGLVSSPLLAQDYPRAQVFGGYQYLHLGNGADVNANGWNASVTGNFNKWFGVAADFSGSYKTVNVSGTNVDAKIYTYTGGPVIHLNSEGKVDPFVHALFGGAHLSASLSGVGSGSENGFTTAAGGGVDVKVNKAIAVRLIQADWVFYRFSGDNESKNVRISTGIVFRF
jgi:hypothetical protein